MARLTQETTIDGRTFLVTQLPGTKAFRFVNRVGQHIGPALAKAVGAFPGDGKGVGDIDVSKLEPALLELASRLDPALVDELMWQALEGALVDGKPLDRQLFDSLFQGKPFAAWKLFAFAMKVQLGDFFDASGDLVRLVQQAIRASASEASTTSPGPSGA